MLLKTKLIFLTRRAEIAISLLLRKIIFWLLGQAVYGGITAAPILQAKEIEKSVAGCSGGRKKYFLVSFPYGEKFRGGVKTIQSHLHCKLVGCLVRLTYFPCFDYAVGEFIRENLSNKKTKIIDEPVYVLPYYNTHFGHLTGELLGSILTYAHYITDDYNRKILMPDPGAEVVGIIKDTGQAAKFKFADPSFFLNNIVVLSDAKILPVSHPVQNVNLLHNFLVAYYPYVSNAPKPKVFITSRRESRISNINELVEFLQNQGFEIMSGGDFGVEQNSKIRNALVLICEDGSLSHLALMHRGENYFTFSPDHRNRYSEGEYVGGYVFNEYHHLLRREIPCRIISTDKHIISSQIFVDITQLQSVLSSLH